MAKFWLIEIEEKEENNGCYTFLGFLVIAYFLFTKVIPKVSIWFSEWHEHSVPVKFVSAFYYYTLLAPWIWVWEFFSRSVFSIWEFMSNLQLTDYPVLNGVITVSVILFVVFGPFAIFCKVLRKVLSIPPITRLYEMIIRKFKLIFALYALGPWILLMVWLGIKLLFWQPEQIDASCEANSESTQVVADIDHTNISNTVEMEVLKTDSEPFPASNEVTVDTSSSTTGVQDPNIEHAERSTNSTEKVEKKGFFRKLKNIVF